MTIGIHTCFFVVNPKDNGGESLSIVTHFVPNGDPGVLYLNQEISLMSYGNQATFNLVGSPLTSDILRQLANEIDKAEIIAKDKLSKLEGR